MAIGSDAGLIFPVLSDTGKVLPELQTAVSRSRLWQHQGKRATAHQRLAEVYGWCTEGFDTADLREAKVWIAELEAQVGGNVAPSD